MHIGSKTSQILSRYLWISGQFFKISHHFGPASSIGYESPSETMVKNECKNSDIIHLINTPKLYVISTHNTRVVTR